MTEIRGTTGMLSQAEQGLKLFEAQTGTAAEYDKVEADYEAFGHRPYGLVELVIGRNSHVFATCLPRWMNWPIVQAFLEPITHSGHFGIQMMGLLNGVSLDRRLVRCYDGFFVQVSISASPWVLGELFQNAPLVADTLHTAGSYPFSERTLRTIVYIAGGIPSF